MDVGKPSFDQLQIFLAVVDEGSFNRAALKLGRAISAISYNIANLEAQLGVRLFERAGSRRPELTEAGKALVAEARNLSDGMDDLVAKVRSLQQGLEAELALAVDVMVPGHLLAELLRDFQSAYPTVALRLNVEALGAVAALLLDGQASLAIAGPDVVDHPELERRLIGSVELVPVAAPTHPLAQLETIQSGEVRKHLQLVLTDRSKLTEGREFSVFSPRTWRLADLGAKHDLLKEGLGWGHMPRHIVERDIKEGILKRLTLPERTGIDFELNALWRKDAPPGPAASWVLAEIKQRLMRMA